MDNSGCRADSDWWNSFCGVVGREHAESGRWLWIRQSHIVEFGSNPNRVDRNLVGNKRRNYFLGVPHYGVALCWRFSVSTYLSSSWFSRLMVIGGSDSAASG